LGVPSFPKPVDCRSLILIELHKKPKGMLAESLYIRIKVYSWQVINEALKSMLAEGVISVTNKRFWAKDALAHYPRKVS
jgi:hypothetical protein